jgi:D-glycero-beta-D-manno-heptose-7-phosphate kinase
VSPTMTPPSSTGIEMAPAEDLMRLNASDRARLARIIGALAGKRIIVLGDLVADEFVSGEIARVSREAPVLILKQRDKRIVPGGGANAANNLVDLGVQLTLLGAAGEDEAGEALLSCFRAKGIEVGGVVRPKDYCTPTKSRILGAVGHGRPQQIVRLDREPAAPLDSRAQRRLMAKAEEVLSEADAVLASDYGYGAVNPRALGRLVRARAAARPGKRPPVMLDSRYHLRGYTGVTSATPNEQEMEQAFGAQVGDRTDVLHSLAARVLNRQRFESLLVTRGRQGMVLYERNRAPQVLRIFGSDQVADVTGAGDTVIAVFTAALAARATFLDAARLANCAGGLVVMKSGTATVTASELSEAIRNA